MDRDRTVTRTQAGTGTGKGMGTGNSAIYFNYLKTEFVPIFQIIKIQALVNIFNKETVTF
jgi:hypothetical protein